MLGLINAVTATFGAIDRYVKQGLVMANRFLTPPKLSHPAQGSAEFNGSSDYIQLDTPFSYTNHTIAAWVYSADTSDANYIFNARDAFNDGYAIYMDSSEEIFYRIGDTSTISTLSSAATNANEWFFIVGTYDSTTQKLYVNGSVVDSDAKSVSIDITTNANIGTRKDTATQPYFKGNLANVAIWNRALSSDEINSVMWKSYEALSGTESNGLQAWYALDDITSPAASLANMQQLATDKDATIENTAAITAAINALS